MALTREEQRMREQWLREGRPQYILLGQDMVEVMTPNGDEEPVFRRVSDGMMYSSLSTTAAQVPEPKGTTAVTAKKTVARGKSAKITDNPKLTDTGE